MTHTCALWFKVRVDTHCFTDRLNNSVQFRPCPLSGAFPNQRSGNFLTPSPFIQPVQRRGAVLPFSPPSLQLALSVIYFCLVRGPRKLLSRFFCETLSFTSSPCTQLLPPCHLSPIFPVPMSLLAFHFRLGLPILTFAFLF